MQALPSEIVGKLPGLENLWLDVPALFRHGITSRFDEDRNYSFAPKRLQRHEGIDFAPVPRDLEGPLLVGAAMKGRVDYITKSTGGYGLHLIIGHEYHAPGEIQYLMTLYAHLEEVLVKPGQLVFPKQPIAYAGASGNVIPSGARHLHFNLSVCNRGLRGYVWPDVVDPLPYLVAG